MKTLKVLAVIGLSALSAACNPNKANTENTFCVANLGPEDTELMLEAANEWHERTDGEVNFHFVTGDCSGYDRIINKDLSDQNKYGNTFFSPIQPTEIQVDNAVIAQHTEFDYSTMYRAVVMHEMGHFLMTHHFGFSWHSSVTGDIMKVGHYNDGVFHLSDNDIANFHKAQE